MTDQTPDTVDFEKALAELEEIVRQLESGELPLAESLDQYEKGVARLRECYGVLEQAEAKIKLLQRSESGELTERDFERSDSDASPSQG